MTARTYGVKANIFPGMGHGLMLERDWEKPARQILDWLQELGLHDRDLPVPASGDVIMFGDVAKRMMKLMGKEPTDKGIVTVEQLPDAIARIKAAIEEDKRQRAGLSPEDLPQTEPAVGGGNSRPFVSLTQRAVPLLELLEWSLKKAEAGGLGRLPVLGPDHRHRRPGCRRRR
jgi:hypothetical protein